MCAPAPAAMTTAVMLMLNRLKPSLPVPMISTMKSPSVSWTMAFRALSWRTAAVRDSGFLSMQLICRVVENALICTRWTALGVKRWFKAILGLSEQSPSLPFNSGDGSMFGCGHVVVDDTSLSCSVWVHVKWCDGVGGK